MPWLPDGKENSVEEINFIRQAIFKRLERAGFKNIPEQILQEKILSPSYLRSRTFSNKGSIYGLSSNHRNAAFYRQDNKSRQIKGLYFAGGSAHPGGGIPLVILSGMNAARHMGSYSLSILVRKHFDEGFFCNLPSYLSTRNTNK
jgi:phytoene dehydrogenase-like protein